MARYTRLQYHDRLNIETLLRLGYSQNQIAQELGRDPSTISREIKKHLDSQKTYRAQYAQRKSQKQSSSRKKDKRKLYQNSRLQRYVEESLLNHKWSPDQISTRLKMDYPQDKTMRMSHEAIYQYIYVFPKGEVKKTLIKGLRQERKYRRSKKKNPLEARGSIQDMLSIHQRPPEVEDRILPGDWESDLIIGYNKQSALLTLVERSTRYTIIIPLPNGRGAQEVREALEQAVIDIPSYLMRSITHDQGKELSQHKLFSKNTGVTVYFADPSSPWQRGTNENTNGLIRQFFPKGTDFSQVSAEIVKEVQDLLNGRPRKVIDYWTPNEVFYSYVALDS